MIEKLRVVNYRNFEDKSFIFSPKINIIIAPNGSGKTNLLESIYMSVFGKSFHQIENYSDFLHPGAESAMIEIIRTNGEKSRISIFKKDNSYIKKFFLNQKPAQIQSIYKKYPVVLFAPNSVNLVSDDPSVRREDLDQYLKIYYPGYAKSLRSYLYTLKNRNNILKAVRDGLTSKKELDFWTDKIVQENQVLYKFRSDFFDKLNNFGENYYPEILKHPSFNSKKFQVQYLPFMNVVTSDFKEALLEKFISNQQKEISAGTTLYGVHKDDYAFKLEDKNLRYYGSRGQQRISAFVLKIIQLKYIQKEYDLEPVFLVDDILSELDKTNKMILLEIINNLGVQTIITSPEEINNINVLDKPKMINL